MSGGDERYLLSGGHGKDLEGLALGGARRGGGEGRSVGAGGGYR